MIGKSIPRKEGQNKVTGAAKYTADFTSPGLLHARLLRSPHAHAKIKEIDVTVAKKCAGVRAIVTGQEDMPFLTGSAIEDRPILALDKVRYFGEPIAVVVADSEHEAQHACLQIEVTYTQLPVVNSLSDALSVTPPLVHKDLMQYTKVKKSMQPKKDSNIADHIRVRKGDVSIGKTESDSTVTADFSFPISDHAAMETRCVTTEVLPNGEVNIHSSSQAPFVIKETISKYFHIGEDKVNVYTPLVGGAFGGKAAIQLELIAVAASRATGGKRVKLANTREADMTGSPSHIGLDAHVELGAKQTGELTYAEINFSFDTGAYVDEGSDITKIAGLNCTGPYKVDHVWADALCVYTNHPYVTSFRGYGHGELTFPIERTMDLLAAELNIDPIELRLMNVIKPGDTTPSQTKLTQNNIGNLSKCLDRVKKRINWDEGETINKSEGIIKAKGISTFWKSSITPTNASAGAILTFNKDGSINISCGAVEIGQGTKTVLTQILAEKMQIDESKIHIKMEVDTEVNPKHWKTVASSSVHMVGNAVLKAADDAIYQLRQTAAIVLRTDPEDVEIAKSRAFLTSNPDKFISIKEIAHGYKYKNGNAIGGTVIGRGNYIMRHLTTIDPSTGKGTPASDWTVGAQAVEVEFDTKTYQYKLLKAVTVIDAGKVLHPKAARGQVTGAMSMGLSWATREGFSFQDNGVVLDQQFRTYKMLRYGENPEYVVDFIETLKPDGPYGARALGEHGIIGMPAALANSLSNAAGVPLNQLPLVPEYIWKQKGGK